MNIRLKNFIFNGLAYGIAFFILSFFLCYYSFNLPLRKSALESGLIGIVTLIFNGLIQSRFTKSLKKLQAITISLPDFEAVTIEAPANHMIDDHLVSGKLFLTQKRLVFRPYQQEQYSWSLANLHSFKFHWSIFNTGGEFIVEDENQNKLVFEVDEVRKWKRALTKSKR